MFLLPLWASGSENECGGTGQKRGPRPTRPLGRVGGFEVAVYPQFSFSFSLLQHFFRHFDNFHVRYWFSRCLKFCLDERHSTNQMSHRTQSKFERLNYLEIDDRLTILKRTMEKTKNENEYDNRQYCRSELIIEKNSMNFVKVLLLL